MKIFACVGTTPAGWDELASSVDRAAEVLGLEGIIQVGNGTFSPTNLRGVSFLPHNQLLAEMRHADLVVTHGGLGSVTESLQHASRLIVAPRTRGPRGAARRNAPNNQWPVALRLADIYGFPCVPLSELEDAIARAISAAPRTAVHIATSPDATRLVGNFLNSNGIKL